MLVVFGGAVAASVRAAPSEETLARVRFDAGVSDEDRRQIVRRLADALATPTGSERARLFLSAGGKVLVSTAAFGLKEEGGIFRGKAADSELVGDVLHIRLDPVALSSANPFAVETFAHEFLGHGVSDLQARRAGARAAWALAEDDEALAETVGLLVQRESGGPLPEEEPVDALIESTAAFAYFQWVGRTGLPDSFAPEEAARPFETLRARLDVVVDAERSLRREELDQLEWRRIMRHFMDVHDEPPSRFAALEAESDRVQAAIGARLVSAGDALAAITGALDRLASPEGAHRARDLDSPRTRRFLAAQRAELLRLLDRLRASRPESEPAASPPAPGGKDKPLDWASLQAEYDQDQLRHPEHWR